jgi:signal transduction histidine kinase
MSPMLEQLRENRAGFLIAVCATVVALLLRLALADVLQTHAQLLVFVVAVTAAAWHGGLWPGLLATVLGMAAGTFFFTEPLYSFWLPDPAERVDVMLFLAASVVISSAMEAMHQSRRRVEHQRTLLEEHNRRREEAEEALRLADRRKDEFLATLAHELRNPLAPILNSLELLRLIGPADPEVQEVRDIVQRQVSYMRLIIDDIMDTSRIAQNKLQLHTERLTLQSIIERAIETSRPMIAAAGHRLVVHVPAQPIYLEADPTRLAQILINLLNNAAKYTEQGGTITLSGERIDSQVIVRIEDNGVGIPADALGHLFEMYSQVDGSLKRSQGGLGLGLPLVQRLVHRHGGTVEAHSDGPGKGSTFVVRLPACVEQPLARRVACS